MTVTIAIREQVDLSALEPGWRDLEARSACAFFLGWTWTGCLIEERFTDPVLVEATEDGRTVALALFNRRRRLGRTTLWLHESGSTALDSPYIEHNGVLTEAGREQELTALCLGAVTRRWRVVLSGVDDLTLAAVRRVAGYTRLRRTQFAPYADLAATRQRGGDFLAQRSANTRQQVRRSERWFRRQAGMTKQEAAAPRIHRALTVAAALTMLNELALLHQATWRRRGRPGSFAEPFFSRFHQALLGRGIPRNEIDLTSISYGDLTVGYLLNFSYRNRAYAYQSGFCYDDAANAARPGLVAHTAAIRLAISHHIDVYDFLAGDSRYKRSLSDAARPLHWLEAGPSWRGLISRLVAPGSVP